MSHVSFTMIPQRDPLAFFAVPSFVGDIERQRGRNAFDRWKRRSFKLLFRTVYRPFLAFAIDVGFLSRGLDLMVSGRFVSD
jgi:hypothetical protein